MASFDAPPPFRRVPTADELQRIGRALRNCVALPQWGAVEHDLRLIDGTATYFAAGAPPEDARAALLRGLAAAGLKIVAADPQSALGRLEQRARSGCAAEGGEPDPDHGDDDLDGLAA